MTNQQIKARFFGMHTGTPYVHDNGVAQFGEHRVHGVAKKFTEDFYYVISTSGGENWHSLDNCKLVLRPLSSITDEEAIDVLTRATRLYIVAIERHSDKIVGAGMGNGNGNIIMGGGNVAMWLKTSPLPMGRFLETWSGVKGTDAPEYMDYIAFDYLRSLNFCLPFMGLDPVKEGWAVLSE